MSLIDKYASAIENNYIKDDLAQRRIVGFLDKILLKVNKFSTWYFKVLPFKIKGLYIMGPVGAGKTFLMDLFYDNITTSRKARFHFHHFMQQIDKKLRELQGNPNPLKVVVKQLSKQVKVLCLDEFLVNDVAYAMILAELLQELFKNKIVLVVTTNTDVDLLYKDGVGRERFLPAIAQIKKNCDIVTIYSDNDHRVGRGEEVQTYFYPLNKKSNQLLEEQFQKIAQISNVNGDINILNRPIKFIKSGKNTVWFKFDDICNVPRCQLDYLEIANKFDTIFISDVPVLNENHTIQALLFMHFVDVAYDRGLRLFISASVSVDNLYRDGDLLTSFARTVSRLYEMQSMDYLRRHKYLQSTAQIL
jgi:cell division protein ZapE